MDAERIVDAAESGLVVSVKSSETADCISQPTPAGSSETQMWQETELQSANTCSFSDMTAKTNILSIDRYINVNTRKVWHLYGGNAKKLI
jgi:hypothetical protein